MATNYVDQAATRTADLGPCRCPVEPRPHVRDSAEVVARFGYGERGRIRQTARTAGVEAGYQLAILLGTKSWTLVLPDGSARPITSAQIALLDEATIAGVEDKLGMLVQDGLMQALAPALDPDDPLPNAPGAPSPDGRSESASPTQTTETPPSSTST